MNHHHTHDSIIIKGIVQILFLIPYSKKFSLKVIMNMIRNNIIVEKYETGLNKTLCKNIIPSPIFL
jgi:hypothetical protein